MGVVGSALGVLAALGAIVLVAATTGSDKATPNREPRWPAPASVVSAVTGVPAQVLDKVGVGAAAQVPSRSRVPALTLDQHPEVLYIGAEYCPYCAAERWSLVQALSRFGTWSNLSLTTSGTREAFPDTPTFTFYGATYHSDYLSFVGKELYTNQLQDATSFKPLEKLTPAEAKVFSTGWGDSSRAGFPYLSIGGSWHLPGSAFDPGVLTGLSAERIAAALSDPSSDVARAADGTANAIAAGLCEVTHGQPASVCAAPGVVAATRLLKK